MSDKSFLLLEQVQRVASSLAASPNRAASARAAGGTGWRSRLFQGFVLLLFAVVPATVVQFFAAPPEVRHVHVEAFRYGKDPAVIRCNRGDELHLTFSSRDTGHSFFLEEFDVDAKITPGSPDVAVFRTSQPEQAPEIKHELVLKAEHPGWLRYLVSKSQYRCHVWCGPMHAFEHGNLIIGPNTLLYAGLGLLLGIPFAGWVGIRRDAASGAGPQLACRARGWLGCIAAISLAQTLDEITGVPVHLDSGVGGPALLGRADVHFRHQSRGTEFRRDGHVGLVDVSADGHFDAVWWSSVVHGLPASRVRRSRSARDDHRCAQGAHQGVP